MQYRDIETNLIYCNGTEFNHRHPTVKDAIQEYAQLLGEISDPVGEHAKKVHLVQVVMILAGTDGKMHVVDSGLMPCEHAGLVGV